MNWQRKQFETNAQTQIQAIINEFIVALKLDLVNQARDLQ